MIVMGRELVLRALEARFEQHPHRHPEVSWAAVQARLEASPCAPKSLQELEATGDEPDLIGRGKASDCLTVVDCSREGLAGRRSTCYDARARTSRKEHASVYSAVEMAEEMGIALRTEARYHKLQALGEADTRTSSWIQTPPEVRAGRRAVLRSPQRQGLRLSQRRTVVLCGQGLWRGVAPAPCAVHLIATHTRVRANDRQQSPSTGRCLRTASA